MEVVNIMDKQKWTTFASKVRTWLEQNDVGAMNAVITANLDAGDSATNDHDRERYSSAVKVLRRYLPGRGFTVDKVKPKRRTNSNSQEIREKMIDSRLISDLFRHRFTNLKAKKDESWWPNSGSITRVLKPLSLADSSEDDVLNGQNKEHDVAHFLMSKILFEAHYVKVEHIVEDDDDLFNEFDGTFKLIGTEQGFLAPESSNWGLLIDRRSWSQLQQDYNGIMTENDVIFLQSGHRLIRVEIATRVGIQRLEELEFLNRYPSSPVSFLMAHYQDEKDNSFAKSFSSEDYYSDWLNLNQLGPQDDKHNLFLRSHNLKEVRKSNSELWTSKDNHSELVITVSDKEEWYFSFERLIPKKPKEDPMGKMADYYPHIYRLHIIKDFVDPETDTDRLETRVAQIYHGEYGLTPSSFSEFVGNLSASSKNGFRFEHLYDVVRSLFAAAGSLDSFKEPGWTCPLHIRKWIGPLKPGSGETVVDMIENIETRLAKYILKYINRRMWLA